MTLKLALITLLVPDYDAAIDFFVGKLGFTLTADDAQKDGKRWVVVTPGSLGTGFLLAKAANMSQAARIGDQTGGRVSFFLETRNFAAQHKRMTAAGVRFLEEPRHEAYGVVAVFEDILGNRWDLIEPKGEP